VSNYYRKEGDSFEIDNLEMVRSFSGISDEKYFVTTHISINGVSNKLVNATEGIIQYSEETHRKEYNSSMEDLV
jgi:hypothetical protein